MGGGGLDVAAYGGEGLGAGVGAEGPGDLVVEFDHSEGALRGVVVEGDGGVVEEPENLVDVVAEADGEVPGGALVDVPAAPVTAAGGGPAGSSANAVSRMRW